MQKNANRSILITCTKLNSKWTKDLNIKPDISDRKEKKNLIEEKMRNSLELIGTGKDFLNRTPLAQALRSTINKWDLMKLKSFCKAKDIVNRTKSQPTEWEKIFTNPTSDRGLIFKIYKEFRKLDTNKPSSPI